MGKKSVTFADIARYTHFSKTTISRYFNDPDSLTVENQEKIAAALEELGYKENKVARILASGKTEFVGVIVPNLYLHFYSQMLDEILATYETYGYKFLVFAGDDNRDVERRYIEELLAYQIEGMIVLSNTVPSEELASFQVPVVTIEREDRFCSSVNTDNRAGGALAAGLLDECGCEVLIHINSDVPESVPAHGRISGFVDACRERGVACELMLRDFGHGYEEADRTMHQVFEELEERFPGRRKGVFVSNDTYANMLVNQIVRTHGGLPDEYRIVGFDDSPVSRESVIPISTVRQQVSRIAQEAMGLLMAQMEERKKRRPRPLGEPVHKAVEPVLVRRETAR
ncbi:LacI family DNA-binding transcriptional regulator [Collinsella tanakaei]|uniref:LacI family DNA-binding transcriptional regulator n=1 Tax=Collinsella ihumii TaxID=1720204 RepID=A0AAW7JNR8_9ACTN|nr:LacI family DNA-binding transcriptional regulator [Collinsella ihumii]MBM6776102.1 LacI family DNA-binding transcriptional regulator [Collinsella tanakaei]MBM6785479.1 LacI family DNA-binding transcriptional regulator [Collinsella tanakaei]MDN0068484.1 LacI family DNA-binding transcriptional regulator [Collinsella ihumii]